MAARHPPCRALKPKEKDYKVTDRDGMYVHVTAKGAMSFRMDCQPMSWLRSTMQPSRPSRNGHPISTAFRFRSGAKDPERNTLRNAVINWPDGDEGEKSHFRDGSDSAVRLTTPTRLLCPHEGHQLTISSGRRSAKAEEDQSSGADASAAPTIGSVERSRLTEPA
jgi:hypothetical protein